jgi:AhpC/TSA family
VREIAKIARIAGISSLVVVGILAIQSEGRETMKVDVCFALLMMLAVAVLPASGKDNRAIVVYDEAATAVSSQENGDAGQLWINTADLARATRFEVKPQGVCRDELCFPLPKARQKEFLHEEAGKKWFNLTRFAELVNQPVAHDTATATWYFGLRSDQRQALASLRAPDFTLPDLEGKPHSLSDFRGKKVLLVTWASW